MELVVAIDFIFYIIFRGKRFLSFSYLFFITKRLKYTKFIIFIS